MGRRGQGGFTYIGLVVLVAVLGMVGAATLKVGVLLQRTAAEQDLLEFGAAFSEALRSYAAATPPGQPQQPATLQELLKDPRFPTVRRHLRKVFVDPMTGKAEWGLMTMGDKTGIIGVYSLSTARPFKIGNFDARFVNFDNKEKISDWKFTAGGQGVIAPPPLLAPTAAAPPLVPPAVPPVPVAEPAPQAEPEPEPEAAPAAPAEPPAEAAPEEADPPKPPEPDPDPTR
jgi:type II secretory pathway pseudopilin PulG